ncbi:MAG TPA: ABC transporter permease [Burkholderiales bacterium]|nr:ABC transporter permease [Burkholderiales bacterium]
MRVTSTSIQLQTNANGDRAVLLSGSWTLESLSDPPSRAWKNLQTAARDSALTWDLRAIEALDSAGALLIWRAWGGKRRPGVLIAPQHEAVFRRIAGIPPEIPGKSRKSALEPVIRLGEQQFWLLDHARGMLAMLGTMLLDAFHCLAHPRESPLREVSATIYKAGAQAMPVTALVGFLIGVVLSYLSADTLKTYGADLYIVDLLGISIIRELGPLLVAILVAGRSGSAMTAQIGVMRVTEEIDAMAILGISPSLRLVLPKVVGLAIALPLVSLWAIAAALAGGAAAAQVQLNMSFLHFFQSLPSAVAPANIAIASVKAVSFGAVVALIACHFGLRALPNTESVSAAITSSVVTSITMVILLDAIFAILFRSVGF